MPTLVSNSQIPATTLSPLETVSSPQPSTPASSENQSAPSSSVPSKAPSASATTDTVKISNAGQQALQEYRETSVQTAQEAARGDLQAKHLLAKEQAAHAAAGLA